MQAIKTDLPLRGSVPPTPARGRPGTNNLGVRLWRHRWAYFLVLPGLLYLILFNYVPLWGNIIAFMDFSPFLGFSGSPWVGLQNFADVFSDPDTGYVIWNTLSLSMLQTFFAFPMAIIVALLLNSLVNERFKRFMQSVLYLPHFIGWVIIVSIWREFFGGDGLINGFIASIGLAPINFLTDPNLFKPMMVLQVIWKETGWGTIIFLAAISNASMNLYEAAVIDGASAWKRMWHVTLPSIRSVIVILLILRMGNILTTGFEQIFLQIDGVDPHVTQTIDIFAYFRGVVSAEWGFSTALGLMKTVVGTCLIILTNWIAKLLGEEGLF